MALIKLGIHRDYCPKWGLWEGIREFMQNSLDEDDKGHKLDKSFTGDCLTLRNIGSEIPPSAMAVGFSSKANDSQSRGQYGEGMKLAMLALIRLGHKVTVATADRTYKPEIVQDDQLGCEILAIRVGKRKWRDDTVVSIEGIEWNDHVSMMSRFTRTAPDLGKVIRTPFGKIFAKEEMKGKVFVKGIYVCDLPGLEYGYDLEQCELDRDRSLPKQFDVEYYAGACVKSAVKEGSLTADNVVSMASSGRVDGRHLFLSYGESPWYTEQVLAAFKKAIPADAYVDQFETIDPLLPFKVERVPNSLSGLKSLLPSVSQLLDKKRSEVIRVFAPSELPSPLQMALSRLVPMMGGLIEFEFAVMNDGSEPMLAGTVYQRVLRVPITEFGSDSTAQSAFVDLCKMAVSVSIKESPSLGIAISERFAQSLSEKMSWSDFSGNPLDILDSDY